MATPYSLISAATANATSVTARPTILNGFLIINIAAAARYVRIYDKASAPVPGTDTPVIRIPLPAGDGTSTLFSTGPISLHNGLAFDITGGGFADTDTTVVAAGDVTLNLFYEFPG